MYIATLIFNVPLCTFVENKSRFPYLKTPGLSDAQRKELVIRLKDETDEMKEKFAVLMGRTLHSLHKCDVSIGELKASLKQFDAPKMSKLSKRLKKVTDINKAFEVLSNFWSFFDYKILEIIIRSYCFDINQDFEQYVSKFKKYCDRRVCEVPDDSYSTKLPKLEEEKKLYIQIDQNFFAELEKMKIVNLKDLTDILRKILDTELRILKINHGSIILTFHCLHELDVLFPLSRKQEEELMEIGVMRIYSGEKEYYPYSPLPTKEGIDIASLLLNWESEPGD